MFRFEYCGFGGYTEPVDEDAWMTQNITDLNESGSDPDALVNNPRDRRAARWNFHAIFRAKHRSES